MKVSTGNNTYEWDKDTNKNLNDTYVQEFGEGDDAIEDSSSAGTTDQQEILNFANSMNFHDDDEATYLNTEDMEEYISNN